MGFSSQKNLMLNSVLIVILLGVLLFQSSAFQPSPFKGLERMTRSTTRSVQQLGANGGSKLSKTKKGSPDFIVIEDFYSDSWKLDAVVEKLKQGKIGVIPTDTCYSFVALLSNKKAVEAVMKVKGSGKKPLSVLCKNLAMVDSVSSDVSREKWVFKMLKSTLPGPYTFIMPAASNFPKMVLERKNHKLNKWKRKEIGVRMPDDPVCSAILAQLDEPLLCGSVPEAGEDELGLTWRGGNVDNQDDDDDDDDSDSNSNSNSDNSDWDEDEGDKDKVDPFDISLFSSSYHLLHNAEKLPWSRSIDFMVLNGQRGGAEYASLSTVVDLVRTPGSATVIRKGMGRLDVEGFDV